jgi:quinoprotein glucose dehydrogenase
MKNTMTSNAYGRRFAGPALAVLMCGGLVGGVTAQVADTPWTYNGGSGGDHFSPLAQIGPENVGRLKQAWRFDFAPGGLEAQPLMVERTLYGFTPNGDVVALDAATGVLKWRFATGLNGGQTRGIATHGTGANRRLLFGIRNFLYAVDASTGQPLKDFGQDGRIDLRNDLRGPPEQNAAYLTSPGAVYGDLIIIGSQVSESTPASPGDIRAYNVKTGKLAWKFHTVPHPGEPGAETWPKDAHLTQGGANAWSGVVVDQARGMAFVATGSAADDFFGGDRPGNNRFANSVIALNARTGKLIWDFQAVRHDIWDLDFGAPPTLMTITRNGRKVDIVAATNKTSYIYAFERATGKPIFPIKEMEVPASTVPGEWTAKTQPIPALPRPLSRVEITASDLTDRTPTAAAWARSVFALLNGPPKLFTPMALGKETLVFAGFTGGALWGGMSADRQGVIYVNATNRPGVSSMVQSSSLLTSGVGEGVYRTQCASCHGVDRTGGGGPSLVNIDARRTEEHIAATVKNGIGRMPGFPNLSETQLNNVVAYLKTGADIPGTPRPPVSLQGREAPSKTLYTSTGNRNFVDPEGFPGTKPPWGTLNAINMNTGEYLWTVPFGVTNNLPMSFGGSTAGGSVVTASGLLFIGATSDRKVRAFDAKNGRVLWEHSLPASAQATPISYRVNGKQYVVFTTSARGGGAAAARADNSQAISQTSAAGGFVAFALD